MLESTVDLLDGLFFIAMILLTAVCILGSIVAALRAVSRGTATSENIHGKLAADITPSERLACLGWTGYDFESERPRCPSEK
jgi:hypothetical protein